MKSRDPHDLLEPDVFDVLCATWVFACNDENPIITYEGIKYRLSLPETFDLKGLVRRRGDLFRRGVPNTRLEAWKQDMKAGKRLPGWIRETAGTLRETAIDRIARDDVFRNQFRAENLAPKVSLEVLDWGLQHIDRLRKASFEARTRSATRSQMYFVLAVGLLNIAATILAAWLKKP